MSQENISVKKEKVDIIAEQLKSASSAIVVEYRGLSVKEITTLRRNLRDEGVEFKVYKNALTQRAAQICGYDDLVKDLVGPNAIAFGGDAVAPSRVLAKFAKDHELLVLKSGVIEGKVVSHETIKEVSKLPNREGMLSMLLGCLQSPVRGFAFAVKAVADIKSEA